MSKILKVRNVDDYCRWLGCVNQHPLVCVINYNEISPVRHCLGNYKVTIMFMVFSFMTRLILIWPMAVENMIIREVLLFVWHPGK